MDLTAPHRVPLSWLALHGGESVKLRTLRELAPPGQPGLDLLETAILEAKQASSFKIAASTDACADSISDPSKRMNSPPGSRVTNDFFPKSAYRTNGPSVMSSRLISLAIFSCTSFGFPIRPLSNIAENP